MINPVDCVVSQPRVTLPSLKLLLKPQPHSGRIGFDLIFLLLVGALHCSIVPAMLGRVVLIDLMTPWLVCTFVAAPFLRSAIICLFAALILETHSASPAGLYMTAYWLVLAVLWLTRSTLSWRHAFPWAVTFFVSELWVCLFESFVMAVSEGDLRLTASHIIGQMFRIVLGMGFGMLLCRRFMLHGVGEEVS